MRRLSGGALVLLAVFAACAPEIVEEPFEPTASHAGYREALVRLELDSAELGERWIAASQQALIAPVLVETPYRELILFDPSDPQAVGYRFEAERGRRITVTVESELSRYFADIFRVPEDGEPVLVASRPPDGSTIIFEPRNDATYLLRLQPELLRGGRFSVEIVAEASLSFPVEGVGPQAILSFYGDSRDAGLRMHEGIDIFAPRGALILAASDSVVQRVGERDRGGNIVTLYDEERELMLYYAHLEEQLVRRGDRVSAGDPIGTNGNTGNAITTPPHLHIGLYQGGWRGDVDPWNYFVDPPLIEPPPVQTPELAGQWVQLASDAVLEPSVPAPVTTPRYINFNPLLRGRRVQEPDSAVESEVAPASSAAAGTAVRVSAVAWRYARVQSADGSSGTVPVSSLVAADATELPLPAPVTARDPWTGDEIARLEAGTLVAYLGEGADGSSIAALPDGRIALLPSP